MHVQKKAGGFDEATGEHSDVMTFAPDMDSIVAYCEHGGKLLQDRLLEHEKAKRREAVKEALEGAGTGFEKTRAGAVYVLREDKRERVQTLVATLFRQDPENLR